MLLLHCPVGINYFRDFIELGGDIMCEDPLSTIAPADFRTSIAQTIEDDLDSVTEPSGCLVMPAHRSTLDILVQNHISAILLTPYPDQLEDFMTFYQDSTSSFKEVARDSFIDYMDMCKSCNAECITKVELQKDKTLAEVLASVFG